MKSIPLSKDLIKDTEYQVLLCSSPANIMVGFAAHTWFLLNRKGKISRWEVLHFKKDRALSVGYLHQDYFDPFAGIEVWPHYKKYHWTARVLGIISGSESSLAADMINFIEKSFEKYPSTSRYSLLGPNSNTYTQWVLNQFPQAEMTLPWNAFGKSYEFKTQLK